MGKAEEKKLKESITGAQFTEMLLCAYEALETNKQAINELNVFPVPDGDTGTNMTLTVSAAAAEMRKLTEPDISVEIDDFEQIVNATEADGTQLGPDDGPQT